MADGLAVNTGVLEVAGGGGGGLVDGGGGLVGGGGLDEPDVWGGATVKVTGITVLPPVSDWIVTAAE
jgi:hypothetical protein